MGLNSKLCRYTRFWTTRTGRGTDAENVPEVAATETVKLPGVAEALANTVTASAAGKPAESFTELGEIFTVRPLDAVALNVTVSLPVALEDGLSVSEM